MEFKELRRASPNETRVAVRHNLGFYNNLEIAAIYQIPRQTVPESSLLALETYALALTECIKQHAFLSVTIHDAGFKPKFTRPAQLNLQNHFRVINPKAWNWVSQGESTSGEEALLRETIERLHNGSEFRFKDVELTPAWAIDVLALSPHEDNKRLHRVLITFSYSHSHGDGISGVAFHQTFYKALQKTLAQSHEISSDNIIDTDSLSMIPEPADTSSTMPISISYLLAPALGHYLPKFLSTLLGFRASASSTDENSWIGSEIFMDDKTPGMKVTTSVELLSIGAETLKSVLLLCKRYNTTLTPLLNFLISKAVSQAMNQLAKGLLKEDMNFVAQIPLNIRKTLGISNSVIGNFINAAYIPYASHKDTLCSQYTIDETSWQQMQDQSKLLASAVSNLLDQPLGLLRFISSIRGWMEGKIGHERDSSWECSNLGSFNPNHSLDGFQDENGKGEDAGVKIENVVFSQPASPLSGPVTFNVIGLRNGGLSIALTWQVGALGLPAVEEESKRKRERNFVQLVLKMLSQQLQQAGQSVTAPLDHTTK